MPLIRVEGGRFEGGRVEGGKPAVADDTFAAVADDAALPASGGAIVSLARFNKEREALLGRNAPIGVRLTAAENPEALGDDVHRLSVVTLEFPSFSDGRAFSWARILRTRMGYKGEVRAVGHFIYDQLNYQKRVGFDAWATDRYGVADFEKAFAEMTNVYQPSTDGKKTIRELRAAK
ncbi:MAG: DUF934 domain-containing protein [Alphaproteobacteria bacterium]|nr:DUF934 domain-containing protein [Alphaproteobacteria bacterium]MBL7097869.1 DUF934 domain-containing protein [Alphaproteobacteria bacterium]